MTPPITLCSPQYGLSPQSLAGGEVYDDNILTHLADEGVLIDVLLPKHKPVREGVKGWTVHRFGPAFFARSYLFNFLMLPKLVRIYRKKKFMILRIHSPYYVGIGAWLFKKIWAPQVKLVATYHHIEYQQPIYHLINKLFIASWDAIIVPSETTKLELQELYTIPSDSIHVYMNGVSDEYVRKESKPEFEAKTPKEPFTLVTCGRLIPRKNITFLMDVIKHLGDNYRLIVVGDGPDRSRLETYAKEHNLLEQVKFTGKVSEEKKISLFQSADVFVFSSYQEGFGLVVAEAMACGCPVIVSDRGALPEVVSDGGLVLALDQEEWVKKITELSQNPVYRKGLADAAYQRSQVFRWRTAARGMITLFQKLCGYST